MRAESANLEPAARDVMAWEVLERLLSSLPGTSPADSACRAAGLPILANSGVGFREAYDLLTSLGRFVSSEGVREAIDQMKATTAAQQHGATLRREPFFHAL